MTDTGYLERLSSFRLSMRQKTSQNLSGNRKSVHKGSSAEFSDFREYMPGDDLRRIDWNAYGRLDKLYIKEYMEEKEAVVTILIDTSASMDYGTENKKELLKKLALAFSFVTLNQSDRLILIDLKHLEAPFVVSGGKRALPKVMNFLDNLSFDGTIDLSSVISDVNFKSSGITFVLSDFFEEALLESNDALRKICNYLKYKRQKPIFLQILSKEEVEVDLSGTFNLIDMEKSTSLRLSLEEKSISAYEKALSDFQKSLQNETYRVGGNFYACHTHKDFQHLILQELRFIYDI